MKRIRREEYLASVSRSHAVVVVDQTELTPKNVEEIINLSTDSSTFSSDNDDTRSAINIRIILNDMQRRVVFEDDFISLLRLGKKLIGSSSFAQIPCYLRYVGWTQESVVQIGAHGE